MKKSCWFFFALFLSLHSDFVFAQLVHNPAVAAAVANATQRPTPRPYPTPTILKSETKTAQDVVDYVYSSEPSPKIASNPKFGGVKGAADVAIDFTDRLLANKVSGLKDVPWSDIELIFEVYGFGDDRLIDNIERLYKMGVRITIVTDANRSVKFEFKEGEKARTDFKNGTLLDNSTGKAIRRLQAIGLDWGKGIESQPVFNDALIKEKDIMHMKNMWVVVKGKPFLLSTSENNYNDGKRVGKTTVITNTEMMAYHYQMYLDTKATFQKSGKIEDIPRQPPLRIEYKDGTYLESHYPTKVDNPWDWQIEEDKIFLNPDEWELEELLDEQFLDSNSKVTESDRAILKVQKSTHVTQIFSNPFLQMGSWGLGMEYAGFDSFRPMGRPGYGFSEEIRNDASGKNRIFSYAYLRPIEGVPVTELGGAPDSEHIIHSKTRIRVYKNKKTGERLTKVITGSFNLSNHGSNLEVQYVWGLKADDELAKLYVGHVKGLTEETWAVGMNEAMVRKGIASVLHRSVFEVSHEAFLEVDKAIRSGNTKALQELIQKVDEAPSPVKGRPAKEEMAARLKALTDLLEWIDKQSKGREILKSMTPPQMVDLLFVTSGNDGITASEQLGAVISKLAFQHGGTAAEQESREKELREILVRDLPSLGKIKSPEPSETGAVIQAPTRGRPVRAASLRIIRATDPAAGNLSALSSRRRVKLYFDWDNDIMKMLTPVYVVDPHGVEVSISNSEFDSHSVNFGKSGPYAGYTLNLDRSSPQFAFREFGPRGMASLSFEQQVDVAMSRPGWKAKAADIFRRALANPHLADDVYIVTARETNVDEFFEGCQRLVSVGFVSRCPKKGNLLLTSDPRLNPPGPNHLRADEFKKKILTDASIDFECPLAAGVVEAEKPLVIFFDDSPLNVQKVLKGWQEHLQRSGSAVSGEVERIAVLVRDQLTMSRVTSDGQIHAEKMVSENEILELIGADCNADLHVERVAI